MSFHQTIRESSRSFFTYRTRVNMIYSVNDFTNTDKSKAYYYCFTLKKELGVFHPVYIIYHLSSYTGTWNSSATVLPVMAYRNLSIPIIDNFVSPYRISNMTAINFNYGNIGCADYDEDVNFSNNTILVPEGSHIYVRNSSTTSRLSTGDVMVDILLRGYHIKL